MSRLAKQLIEKEKRERTGKLDLGRCGLTDLNDIPELFELEWLEELNFFNQWWDYEKREWVDSQNKGEKNRLSALPHTLSNLALLKSLKIVRGDGWPISDIHVLEKLNSLTSLYFESYRISDYSFLKKLTSLTSLYLISNQISDYSFLEKLTSLTFLGLQHNKISDIRFWENLTSLTSLSLQYNKISDYSFLEKLTSLTSLSLQYNKISDYSFLEKLTSLTSLSLQYNEISDIRFLENLTSLTSLNLSRNEINDIRVLEKLTSLTSLGLRYNKISDIRFLENLTSLTSLDLSHNKIDDIRVLEKFPNLTSLYLRNNQINTFSYNLYKRCTANLKINVEFLKLLKNICVEDQSYEDAAAFRDMEDKLIKGYSPSLQETTLIDTSLPKLILGNNPLTAPSLEVVTQGHSAILRYFEESERSGTHKLMESRLLIVGQGGAGKTSLKRKLKNVAEAMPEPGDTTRGIEIETLSLKTTQGEDFTLNVWDFGGQNIQHYAHQFFLSGSSLYVLVHNQREQNTNFQYWLNIIEMLGQASPVIILQNEVAGHCDPLDNAGSIRDRFKNVQEPFHAVDLWNAATDGRFETLKSAITAIASNPELLPHFGTTRPVSYVRVQEKLAAYPSEQQFITWQTFEEICAGEGVTNPDLVRDYSYTFTVLGKCLHFPNDVELRNFIFLRPKWIIDALFSLLYHKIVIDKNGEFEEIDTVEIWKGREFETMHGKLIRLMENFELCYPVAGSEKRRFIVPQRLPSAGTSFPWAETGAVRVVYRYKFMPKGVVTRLICRLHRHIENDHVWSDAVIFAKPQTGRIFVRERYAEDEIWIEAVGKKRSDLINLVVETIDHIHKESKFANLRVSKLIPCNCRQCQREAEPYYFDYDYLVGLLGKNRFYADCQKSYEEIEIRSFLASVFENGDEPPAYILAIKDMIRLGFGKNEEYHEATHQQLNDIQQSLRDTQALIAANQSHILQALENNQTDDAVLQGYLTDIMEKLDQVAEKQESFASLPYFQEVKKTLKTDADIKGKFKLTWNLLPKILTDLTGLPNIAYEKELGWDLKAVVQQIVQDFKNGHVFLKKGE